jgi:large-conductance mechanosensitive channel
MYLPLGSAKILFGSFISSLIDFLIVAFVLYFSVKLLRLDRSSKKSDKK